MALSMFIYINLHPAQRILTPTHPHTNVPGHQNYLYLSSTTQPPCGLAINIKLTFYNTELIVTPWLEVIESDKKVGIVILLAGQEVFFGHPFCTKDVMGCIRQRSTLQKRFCKEIQTRVRVSFWQYVSLGVYSLILNQCTSLYPLPFSFNFTEANRKCLIKIFLCWI